MLTRWMTRAAWLLGLAALLLLGCSRRESAEEEFRLGLLAPLTDRPRFTGHLTAQQRVAELNAAGGLELGGRKVKVRLLVEDSGPSIEHAMAATSRLAQQRVSAVIGPYYSREAIPVGAALESLRIPMVTTTATNPAVTRDRSFSFRVCQLDSQRGRALARYAYEDLGLRRAAVLYDEADAYSAGLAGYFRENFAPLRGAKVHLETYPTGVEGYGPQMERIRASGAQVLLLPNVNPDLSAQLQQARAAGFTGLLLGGDSWDADHSFHGLPEAQGALYSTDFALAAAAPALVNKAQALADKIGGQLDKDTAMTLDALELVLAAARAVGSTDPVSLRSGLASLQDFEGLSGRMSFNGGGDPQHPMYLLGISGGAASLRVRLEPARNQ